MKKNKSVLVALLFLVIMLVQPQNLQRLVTIFTQNDIATQLNIERKMGETNKFKDTREYKKYQQGLQELKADISEKTQEAHEIKNCHRWCRSDDFRHYDFKQSQNATIPN